MKLQMLAMYKYHTAEVTGTCITLQVLTRYMYHTADVNQVHVSHCRCQGGVTLLQVTEEREVPRRSATLHMLTSYMYYTVDVSGIVIVLQVRLERDQMPRNEKTRSVSEVHEVHVYYLAGVKV